MATQEAKWRGCVAESLALMGAAAGDLGRWEETAARCAESLELCGTGETWDRRIALEWAFIGLAGVALTRGRPARAARLLGATDTLLGSVPPVGRRNLDRAASAVRAQMEAEEFEAAWSAGQALPLDQAIALALQEALAG